MSADHKILGLFTENEIKGLHTIRNIGAHDYDGLKLDVIEETIRLHLPPLKEKIDNFVKEYYVNLKQKEAIKTNNQPSVEDVLSGKAKNNIELDDNGKFVKIDDSLKDDKIEKIKRKQQ